MIDEYEGRLEIVKGLLQRRITENYSYHDKEILRLIEDMEAEIERLQPQLDQAVSKMEITTHLILRPMSDREEWGHHKEILCLRRHEDGDQWWKMVYDPVAGELYYPHNGTWKLEEFEGWIDLSDLPTTVKE